MYRKAYKRVVRPQTAAVLAAVLFCAVGYLTVPKIVRPTQAAGVPEIKPATEQHVRGASIVAPVDCGKVPCMALTFDDGPNAEVTPRVLDILAAHNVKATFFLIGERVPGNERLVRRIHQDGHEIGNHTWSHHKLSELSPQGVEDDIAHAQRAIVAAGVPTPNLFRPPYGDVDAMVRSHIAMTIVSWNIDPTDWKADTPQEIIDQVLAHAKPGGIVDLHDIHSVTADALDSLINALQQNYHLVTASQLLGLPPGQPGIFYGR